MNMNAQSKDKGMALKDKVSTPNSTLYSKEKIMMLTWNFEKLLRKSGKIPKSQGMYKSEI